MGLVKLKYICELEFPPVFVSSLVQPVCYVEGLYLFKGDTIQVKNKYKSFMKEKLGCNLVA